MSTELIIIATSIVIVVILLMWLTFTLKSIVREAIKNSKPTTINHGTIHHHYEKENEESSIFSDKEKEQFINLVKDASDIVKAITSGKGSRGKNKNRRLNK